MEYEQTGQMKSHFSNIPEFQSFIVLKQTDSKLIKRKVIIEQ